MQTNYILPYPSLMTDTTGTTRVSKNSFLTCENVHPHYLTTIRLGSVEKKGWAGDRDVIETMTKQLQVT